MSNIEKSQIDTFKKFYENLGKYKDIEHYVNPTGISRKEKVIRMLSPRRNDIVCDLGCGDGNLSKSVVSKVKKTYGADISKIKLERAKKKDIETVCSDVSLTPFEPDFFDKVICSEVIEHVLEPKKVINEIHRILKLGGDTVITVPLDEKIKKTLLQIPESDLINMDYNLIKKKHNIEHCHLNSFSEKEFIKLLEEIGFIVKEIDYTYQYNPIFRADRFYKVLSFILSHKITEHSQILENIFNRIIFAFYTKKNFDIRHLIVCSMKDDNR